MNPDPTQKEPSQNPEHEPVQAQAPTSLKAEADEISSNVGVWLTGLGLAMAAGMRPKRAHAQSAADIAALNALLSAEWAAIDAYSQGAAVLAAPANNDPLRDAAPTVLAVAAHFRQQHRDHAAQLAARITAAGGTPVAEPAAGSYQLPNGFTATVLNVIRLATNEEKNAAVAYCDVLNQVSSETFAELIASIGGVETQHFIVLSLLAQGVVQATSMTAAMAMEMVPRSFVTSPADGIAGLNTVADFTYEAL